MNKNEFDRFYIIYPKSFISVDVPEELIIPLREIIKDKPEFEWFMYQLDEIIDEESLEV